MKQIAEMRTGEQTLVATLPAYLNALAGDAVHLVTVNDYLAGRDAAWMGPIYNFLGMTVGVIRSGQGPPRSGTPTPAYCLWNVTSLVLITCGTIWRLPQQTGPARWPSPSWTKSIRSD